VHAERGSTDDEWSSAGRITNSRGGRCAERNEVAHELIKTGGTQWRVLQDCASRPAAATGSRSFRPELSPGFGWDRGDC